MGLAHTHISSNKEMISMNETKINCVGKKQPSKQALEKFIKVYKRMVEANGGRPQT